MTTDWEPRLAALRQTVTQADADALASDWQAVGDDLRAVMPEPTPIRRIRLCTKKETDMSIERAIAIAIVIVALVYAATRLT